MSNKRGTNASTQMRKLKAEIRTLNESRQKLFMELERAKQNANAFLATNQALGYQSTLLRQRMIALQVGVTVQSGGSYLLQVDNCDPACSQGQKLKVTESDGGLLMEMVDDIPLKDVPAEDLPE